MSALLVQSEGLLLPVAKCWFPLGLAPVSSGPQMQTLGLAAGVHKDGNPGQGVLKRTVIFVQLHL